ncbi:hypothetical protein BH23CHL7_BH23CHL7_21420 [soil metagenome]
MVRGAVGGPASDPVVATVGNGEMRDRTLLRALHAVRRGDFSVRLPLDAAGIDEEVAQALNDIVELNERTARELRRLSQIVGREGQIRQRAKVGAAEGEWASTLESVNDLIADLAEPMIEVTRVVEAVAKGDLAQRVAVEIDGRPLKGEFRRSTRTINTMVDQLNAFAGEVTRVAREVGTEGKLGGQAEVRGVEGTWKDLTDSVNSMAANLTTQVRNIADVTTAVARGDLSKKITVDVRGEILELKDTINTMVDQLNAFAGEVTRVAREVGTEGKLGGQAEVRGVEGTWKDLTDNVNQLAANLTTEVRAIGDVATAVTRGDLSRSIQGETRGELEVLRNDLNEMIGNLRDTTQRNKEQDWLNTNVAQFSQQLQGERDMQTVARLTLSELARLIDVQRGAVYLHRSPSAKPILTLLAAYAHEAGHEPPPSIRPGEGLVGQCAVECRRILLQEIPTGYATISSALGSAAPRSLVILPVLFENEVLAVIELASFASFSDTQLAFLEQVTATLGIALNTIAANRRSEQLVQEQAARAEAEVGLARLRQVVDVMPEGILIVDAAGEVYLSNAAAEDIMGRVPSSVMPGAEDLPRFLQLDGSVCRPEDQPLARTVLRGEIARGEQLVITNSVTERDVPILVNSAPLIDSGGNPAGGVAVFQDITPLRDLDRQMDGFLASVSHDLKTPATIIKGRANLLLRSVDATGQARSELVAEGAQAIDEATAQLVRLVDELLDLSRLRMGQQVQLEFGPTDLVKIASRLAHEYQNMSPRHVINVLADGGRLVGDWDAARMERVLANLISNAVKYSPQGGEISVRVAPQEHEGHVWAVIEVEDHGLGIPAPDLERIFEPYYRGSNVPGSVSGTGVGLAGTRHIVEQHGGEISVESEVGQGTVMRVRLPLLAEGAELVDA